MAKNINSNVGKNINSFNTSNINKNNLTKLENIYLKLSKYNNKESSNVEKAIYKGTYEEIRQKFYGLSYEIYLKCYIDKPESELYKFIELQKNLLDTYKKHFDNPRKIKEYIKKMQTILFLRFPKRPIINSKSLVWQNSFGKLNQNKNIMNKYNENIEYFLNFLKTELFNLQENDKNNLDKINKKFNMLEKLFRIYIEHNLTRSNSRFVEIFKFCYKKILENIYNIAKDKKNIEEFLKNFEIFNKILANYGKYFGYPINSNNSNDKLLQEKIDELFKILKNMNINNSSMNTNSKPFANLNNYSSINNSNSFVNLNSSSMSNNNSEATNSDTKSIIRILKKKFMNNLNNKDSPIFVVYKNVSNKHSKEDVKLIYFSNKKIIRIGQEDYHFQRSHNGVYLFSSIDQGHLIIQGNGNVYKLRYKGSKNNIEETFILTKIENNVKWETYNSKNIMPIFDEILFYNNIDRSRVTKSTANFVRSTGMGNVATAAAAAANMNSWQNYPNEPSNSANFVRSTGMEM